MHDSQIFRRLRVNSLICTNSGLFSIKTSNFTTFRPISQVANSCRIISHLYRNITDAPEKIRLIEKKVVTETARRSLKMVWPSVRQKFDE